MDIANEILDIYEKAKQPAIDFTSFSKQVVWLVANDSTGITQDHFYFDEISILDTVYISISIQELKQLIEEKKPSYSRSVGRSHGSGWVATSRQKNLLFSGSPDKQHGSN